MRKVQVLEKRRLLQGFLSVVEVSVVYEKPDGNLSEPTTRQCLERGDAVAVLLHDVHRNRLLFVRQFRYACLRHEDPFPLEIVAGAIDEGEKPEEAARREVLEEVGYDIEELVPVLQFYSSPGTMSEMLFVYYARIAEQHRKHEGNLLEGEDLELVEMTPDEAWAKMDKDEVRDAKTLLALQWLRLQATKP